ncbi:MAG: proline--tRNA ligase [Candidatus Ancillula sp.]|nr:proline--tRNA ligase [Candidatus Ancillula sp.]
MSDVTKLSELFFTTLRDDPADAEVASHKLLLRAGYIRQVSPGIFSWLPLGLKVLSKIECVIDEEMRKIGGQRVHFPALLPRSPYETTDRWSEYGDNLFRLQDRRKNDYLLAPTHEEMFTLLVKDLYSSYKDMPAQLYQIQTKYRDEARPRAGLLRGREFIMKDAYSFDMTDEGLEVSYALYRKAYEAIFQRLNLPYVIVKAQSGAMGGSNSEEFLSPTPIGEDTFVRAPSGYAANVEAAEMKTPEDDFEAVKSAPPIQNVSTPNVTSIEDVAKFLDVPKSSTLKAVYLTLRHPKPSVHAKDATSKAVHASDVPGREVVIVYIPGDRELDMKRVEAIFAPAEVDQSSAEDLAEYPDLVPGFTGPVLESDDHLGGGARSSNSETRPVCQFFDVLINVGSSWVSGGNAKDVHRKNTVAGRDFQVDSENRIGAVKVIEGDEAIDGSGEFEIMRGVEIGHIFALGRKYTEAFGATVLDEHGKAATPTMGSYGIGVTRALALLAENYHDEKGLAWPSHLAPADVHICVAAKDEDAYVAAELTANALAEKGVEVFLDDRKQASPGVKFKDAELLGVPQICVFGRGLSADTPVVELKMHDGSDKVEVSIQDVGEEILRRKTMLQNAPRDMPKSKGRKEAAPN